jgi:hypothetical protein
MKEIPMLFNTAMVQAILAGTKRQTRRIIKDVSNISEFVDIDKGRGTAVFSEPGISMYERKLPCQVGDILWVRETWGNYSYDEQTSNAVYYLFKADYPDDAKGYWYEHEHINFCDFPRWRPSIHMPREAARLFLEVKGVRTERLQDIDGYGVEKEGLKVVNNHLIYQDTETFNAIARKEFKALWNSIYATPAPVKKNGIITHYESYPWEDIQETREYKGKPWIVCGNPWVWVIEFERM